MGEFFTFFRRLNAKVSKLLCCIPSSLDENLIDEDDMSGMMMISILLTNEFKCIDT